MAGRQNKVGLDYFELDCQMEEKVRLIQAEYGMKGFAVFVKLLQRIYGENGYYCEWTQDSELLFASENGLNSGSLQLLRDIVSACIRRNIFSERLFKEYGILTSCGIQKRYLKATSKREVVDLKKEYLLISVPENRKNVLINSISSSGNSINDVINSKSRVEKSREENINNMHKDNDLELFESFWSCYPIHKNRSAAEKAYCDIIVLGIHTEDELVKASENYAEYCRLTGTDKIYHACNFLSKAAFEDYLPGRYRRTERRERNAFMRMEKHDYDFDALERELLENGGAV